MKRFSLLIAIFALLLSACKGKNVVQTEPVVETPSWQEQYDLGVRYLSEGNYEEAIIAFTAAIEIDPKRSEAYLSLAEVYVAQEDYPAAVAILQQGIEAAGSSALQERLDELESELEPAREENNAGDRVALGANGMDVDADGLKVQATSSRSASITIGNLSLKDSYTVNLSTSKKDAQEYNWQIKINGKDGSVYAVATTHWAFAPGREEERTVDEMQHSLWAYDGDSFKWINDVSMTHTENSITWDITIPEEYPFDFSSVGSYEVEMFDISSGLDYEKSYAIEGGE